jgi:signal transduction histidine kinase
MMRKINLMPPLIIKTIHPLAGLSIAIKEIELQKIEHLKVTSQLSALNKELRQVVSDQNSYIKDLNKMLVMVSHNLRQPIAHIIGLCSLFSGKSVSTIEQGKIAGFMKQAVSSLDVFTRELNAFIQSLITKLKKK